MIPSAVRARKTCGLPVRERKTRATFRAHRRVPPPRSAARQRILKSGILRTSAFLSTAASPAISPHQSHALGVACRYRLLRCAHRAPGFRCARVCDSTTIVAWSLRVRRSGHIARGAADEGMCSQDRWRHAQVHGDRADRSRRPQGGKRRDRLSDNKLMRTGGGAR